MIFRNMGLRGKIACGICIPLVLLVMLGIISISSIHSMIETDKWVEHTHLTIRESMQIIGLAVDMETGGRGFLLAGKEEFLEPYIKSEKILYEKISSLKTVVSDNPKQVIRLDELEKIMREWQKKAIKPTIALRREIGHAKTMNDMAELVGEAHGKKYFDKFRSQINMFISRETDLILKRRKIAGDAKASHAEYLRTMNEAAHRVEHTHRVIARAERILTHATDMETGMRGFLLSGDNAFLEPYNTGREHFFN